MQHIVDDVTRICSHAYIFAAMFNYVSRAWSEFLVGHCGSLSVMFTFRKCAQRLCAHVTVVALACVRVGGLWRRRDLNIICRLFCAGGGPML